eukprot:2946889-Pyramimonas_sp.AAC.2
MAARPSLARWAHERVEINDLACSAEALRAAVVPREEANLAPVHVYRVRAWHRVVFIRRLTAQSATVVVHIWPERPCEEASVGSQLQQKQPIVHQRAFTFWSSCLPEARVGEKNSGVAEVSLWLQPGDARDDALVLVEAQYPPFG